MVVFSHEHRLLGLDPQFTCALGWGLSHKWKVLHVIVLLKGIVLHVSTNNSYLTSNAHNIYVGAVINFILYWFFVFFLGTCIFNGLDFSIIDVNLGYSMGSQQK